jgi:hypothetical protein
MTMTRAAPSPWTGYGLLPERDANYIIPRVLEKGRLEDVRWLIGAYGLPRIRSRPS